MLKNFHCHINVEYVGNIGTVKHLYKYIYKGHGCTTIKIVENKWCMVYNESEEYLEGRCITPTEARWQLFSYDIQNRALPFKLICSMARKLSNTTYQPSPRTIGRYKLVEQGLMLEAFFQHNKELKQMLLQAIL